MGTNSIWNVCNRIYEIFVCNTADTEFNKYLLIIPLQNDISIYKFLFINIILSKLFSSNFIFI